MFHLLAMFGGGGEDDMPQQFVFLPPEGFNWEAASVVVAALGIGVTLGLFWLKRRKKGSGDTTA